METTTLFACSSSCVCILSILTTFLPSCIQASYDYDNWIIPTSPTLPRPVEHAAAGYDRWNFDRIWIVGGMDNPKQLISYDIDSNAFNTTALSWSIYGWGA
eukprot:892706_1